MLKHFLCRPLSEQRNWPVQEPSRSLLTAALLAVASIWPVAGAYAQVVPPYETGFEAAEGYTTGSLDGQNGWIVMEGSAEVTDQAARTGKQSVVLHPAGPATVIRRDLSAVFDDGAVFVDFYVRGAAGEPPAETPEAFSPDVFYLALVRESEESGRFFVIDGDGIGGGAWVPLGPPVPLDASGRTLDWLRLSVRVDLSRTSFDVWIGEELAGINLGFVDGSLEAFESFALRGHPNLETYFDDFSAGQTHPFSDNVAGDGIDDVWKNLYSLSLDEDLRDLDLDGDGLSVIEEYFWGSDPTRRDTSRDGFTDGEAVALDLNPLIPSNRFPVALPFFDDFEGWPLGSIDGRGGWQVGTVAPGAGFQVSGNEGTAKISEQNGFLGERALRLDATDGAVAVQVEVDENAEPVVWTDFYANVAAHTQAVPPEVSGEAAVAFYFDDAGRAVAWDGTSAEWVFLDPPAFYPFSLDPHPDSRPDWCRVTVRQDFTTQTWSLWLNAVRVAEGLGFANPQSSYSRFRASQPDSGSSVFDEVYIGLQEPPMLDDDGDGLTNEEEIVLGSDPGNPDTSADGMWDGNKVLWGFDPSVTDDFGRPVADAEGRRAWSSDFEADEGFFLGELDSQNGWEASDEAEVVSGDAYSGSNYVRLPARPDEFGPASAVRFFGTENDPEVWVTSHVRAQPGRLPDVSAIQEPRAALVAVNVAGFLFAWDGAEERWINSAVRLTESEWVRLDIGLDYERQRWKLCVDGVLVLSELGFRDSGLRALTRFGISGSTVEGAPPTGLDLVRVELKEPEGLDFSGDGLSNDEKRELGLDIYAEDTTGDGIPDWWLVAHGLNAADSDIGDTDPFGTGLTVRQNYLLGTRPDLIDTDGDGWSDFEEYLAGTGPLDPASAPDEDGLAEWMVAQVGDGLEPHAFRVGGDYRIAGSGQGTKGTTDAFTFAYREISGNFEMVARVRTPQWIDANPGAYPSWLSQNGLMARTSLDGGARYSAVFSAPFWCWTRFREAPGELAFGMTHKQVHSGDATYMRIRRFGDRFRHYLSDDGDTWFLLSDVAISMPEAILVGMFLSSNSDELRLRGRLSEVEIVELPSGDWQDEDAQTDFDSFAWMGEWDGLGDHQDPALLSRQPSLEELHAVGLQAPVALELVGADAVDTIGAWHERGSSLVCLDRRGWIEFDLEVQNPGLFLIELEGVEHNNSRETISSFDLKFYLETEYLGTRMLEATPESPGAVYVFSPWLDSGSHRLRVLWDGARSRTRLQVDAVRLRTIDGAAVSENGIPQWIEDRLSRHSGADPQPQAFTYVSPLPLEGRDRFNSLMRVDNVPLLDGEPGEHRDASRPFAEHPRGEIGRDFKATREDLRQAGTPAYVDAEPHLLLRHGSEWAEYLTQWSAPVSFNARRGPGHRFWSDVPLAPLVDNAITLSWQSGVAEERRMARWVPYNVLEGGLMELRAGDSMLLIAHEGNQQSGDVFLDVNRTLLSGATDSSSFQTIPASPLVYTFNEPGEYVVEGTYLRENAEESSAALRVVVSEFSFPKRPLIYVARERQWAAKAAEQQESPAYVADPLLGLEVTGANQDILNFSTNNNAGKTIAARGPGTGALLDAVEVEPFRLFSSWETYATVVDTLPDGTKLVEMMMILSPVPDDVRIHLDIFVGGILFDDGTVERWLYPEDFDELGQVTFRFIMPEEAISSVCHRTNVYQDDVLIGVR